MKLQPYSPSYKTAWDTFVESSRNGTFLFFRDFMEYHADRFEDASLIFMNEKGRIKGILPASWHEELREIRSHGGLTYGGFVLSSDTHAAEAGEMMELTKEFYFTKYKAQRLILSLVPHIYHRQPADDARYWLFRYGAHLHTCGLSSAIDLRNPGPISTLRRRCFHQALRYGLEYAEVKTDDIDSWTEYWRLLTAVLQSRHGVKPVHSLSEITMLAQRFPHNIRLKIVRHPLSHSIIAGCVLFMTEPVVHVQYIATEDEGRKYGALDLLFTRLIQEFSPCDSYRYLDFGISTEDGGHILNEGLNRQKEGFGARSVVYESYILEL